MALIPVLPGGFVSGDANLISVSIASLQEALCSVPETWDQQTIQEGTQDKR